MVYFRGIYSIGTSRSIWDAQENSEPAHYLMFVSSLLSYAASPENFEYMLDRMVGSHGDGVCDDIMRFSSCVSGNYWYFPSNQQLKLIATS
jgi:hypothetical protein